MGLNFGALINAGVAGVGGAYRGMNAADEINAKRKMEQAALQRALLAQQSEQQFRDQNLARENRLADWQTQPKWKQEGYPSAADYLKAVADANLAANPQRVNAPEKPPIDPIDEALRRDYLRSQAEANRARAAAAGKASAAQQANVQARVNSLAQAINALDAVDAATKKNPRADALSISEAAALKAGNIPIIGGAVHGLQQSLGIANLSPEQQMVFGPYQNTFGHNAQSSLGGVLRSPTMYESFLKSYFPQGGESDMARLQMRTWRQHFRMRLQKLHDDLVAGRISPEDLDQMNESDLLPTGSAETGAPPAALAAPGRADPSRFYKP